MLSTKNGTGQPWQPQPPMPLKPLCFMAKVRDQNCRNIIEFYNLALGIKSVRGVEEDDFQVVVPQKVPFTMNH
jgi:hypothetical protein